MDLDRLGQRLVVSPVTLPGGMASFSTAGTGTESAASHAARSSALVTGQGRAPGTCSQAAAELCWRAGVRGTAGCGHREPAAPCSGEIAACACLQNTPAVTSGRRGLPLTCHVLCPPGGTWPGRPPGARSKLARGWTRSACSARRCDTAGR